MFHCVRNYQFFRKKTVHIKAEMDATPQTLTMSFAWK